MAQWLGLQASTAGDRGPISGQGTKISCATHTAKKCKLKKKNQNGEIILDYPGVAPEGQARENAKPKTDSMHCSCSKM